MLDHLWCAVGTLHSQKILNFGFSGGGGGGLGHIQNGGQLSKNIPFLCHIMCYFARQW